MAHSNISHALISAGFGYRMGKHPSEAEYAYAIGKAPVRPHAETVLAREVCGVSPNL